MKKESLLEGAYWIWPDMFHEDRRNVYADFRCDFQVKRNAKVFLREADRAKDEKLGQQIVNRQPEALAGIEEGLAGHQQDQRRREDPAHAVR